MRISDWEGGHALPEQAASDVRTFGIYRVRDYFERAGIGHLVLHHAGQRWEGVVRNPAAATGVRSGTVVEVQFSATLDGPSSICFIRALESGEYQPSQVMPTSWCIDGSDPDRLRTLIERLTTAPFRHWMEAVVDDLALLKRFFQLKASYKHHHSVPGGLLRHSLETAEIVEKTLRDAPATCSTLIDDTLRDGLVLAALFHDFGKTISHASTSPWLLRKTDHRHLSLVALAMHLPRLAELSVPAHAVFVHSLIQDALGKGYASPLPMVDAVRMADRVSTGLWMHADIQGGRLTE
ncbi:TraI domain-containing protein [Thioalkalivibrio sp. AKL10]|uniref:TraI domain-containing protein n=1 Tax=Thioalkalivibrio sp. AKL10 TaxID=1158158 RepID=UPI000361FAEC|nr:HD domain-containing protein [Thioalkalivibrio sp. AKL10]